MTIGMTIHELSQLLAKCGVWSLTVTFLHGGWYVCATLEDGNIVTSGKPRSSLQRAYDVVVDEALARGRATLRDAQ